MFAVRLFYAAGAVTFAQPLTNQRVMLINVQTGKCLTIAGGVSTDNNVTALQFDHVTAIRPCSWSLNATGAVYRISNVQTRKCGRRSPEGAAPTTM